VDVSNFAPGPFCSMLLADFGADVIAVGRPGSDLTAVNVAQDLSRGKRSIVIDLRTGEGARLVAELARTADVFVESFRPGVMELRGLGPDDLRRDHPELVYTRISGWGHDGPYASRAGHDINFISIGGALGAVAAGEPRAPGAMLGDLASGALLGMIGTMLALYDRQRTGLGQVVDAAMVDGAALLTLPQLAMFKQGRWRGGDQEVLNGAAPFYGTYLCADDRWVSVGAVEPKFYANLLSVLGLDASLVQLQDDRASWPQTRREVAARFRSKPRSHWEREFARADACATPVLALSELEHDDHLLARRTVVPGADGPEVGRAPRLSRLTEPLSARPAHGGDAESILSELGYSGDDVKRLQEASVVGRPPPEGAGAATAARNAAAPRVTAEAP
jgi:alpha-methylacyl-CoA racemase